MTNRELLISLHQKFDKERNWTQRQVTEIVHEINGVRNIATKITMFLMKHTAARGEP